MSHKVVALRIKRRGDVLTLTALGQSPRGTRVMLKSAKVDLKGQTKEQRQSTIESELKVLVPGLPPAG